MGLSEKELVQKILAGEKAYFENLISKYQKSIYNLVYRMMGNREDALDLSQETFLKAFSKLETFDLERPFSPWIHKIAKNLCINQLRKRKAKTIPLSFSDNEGQEMEREIADLSTEPGERVLAREKKHEALKAIDQLPEKYRTVLILRHLNHHSYEEIGEILEVPSGTVKTWIYRGRNKLKKYLKESLEYREGEK